MGVCQAVFLFLTVLALGHAELRCYDCEPNSTKGKCLNPVDDLEPQKPCEKGNTIDVRGLKKEINEILDEDKQKRIDDIWENGTFECYSLHFQPDQDGDNNKAPGVYRGCVILTESTESVCDLIGPRYKGKVSQCTSCKEDSCNQEVLKLSDDGAANSISISFALLIINCIICVYIFEF